MLYISRKPRESIYISNNIKITVMSIQGNMVKLGIECDRSVPVFRSEIYEQIKRKNTEDAASILG